MLHAFIRSIGLLSGMLWVAGCCTQANMHDSATVIDLDAEIARAGRANQPVVILIGEFGPESTDDAHRNLLYEPNIREASDHIQLLTIDLYNSRNRATAARYHPVKSPVIVCLSPKGIIVSRDVGWENAEKVLMDRLQNLRSRAIELDKQLALASIGMSESSIHQHLAAFLLEHQNDLEAIPHLASVADSQPTGSTEQIDARVEIARAHLWIGEPEKARHEAKELIAGLGSSFPRAIAGGSLILGLQDTAAKRFALARTEFQTALSAAPDSTYARQATAELAKLSAKGTP